MITLYNRPIFIFWLVKIWQVSSCRNWFIQHLEPCLLSVWQLKLTEYFVNLWCFLLSFSTGCLKWNTAAIKSLLWFMAGLFIEFLVGKCAGCQSWKTNLRCIAFVFTLLDAGWKVPQAILALVSKAASRVVSLSNYCIQCMFVFLHLISWSRAQFMRLIYARLY